MFRVTLEPKVADRPERARNMEPGDALYCPFCESTDIEELPTEV